MNHFRLAYAGVIKPLTDKSHWAHVELGFKLRPPLQKRPVKRHRKNRTASCLEMKGNNSKNKGRAVPNQEGHWVLLPTKLMQAPVHPNGRKLQGMMLH